MGRASRFGAGIFVLAVLLVAPSGASAAGSLLPWPNDLYTRADKSTPTGRRLALPRAQMPRNAKGVPIDPTPYNASDGFSPGQTIVARIPGLDNAQAFKRTGLVPQTDLARYADRNQPLVVIDAKTLKRHLVWAELDSNAAKDSERVLLVHPGVNWEEGHRYVVALRRLRGADGRLLVSPKGRRKPAESILATLQKAGIARADLYDAWDFTVASATSLAGRALSIRDRGYAELGDKTLTDGKVQGKSPAFKVTKVETFSEAEQPNVARRVEGTFTVPCFLDKPGCPTGSKFRLDKRGLPVRTPGNTYEARFLCNVPRSASAAGPARPSLYGHGLFGEMFEIRADNVEQLGNENNVLVCAGDWIGMADEDVPNAAALLQDLSKFPSLPDRVQQGYLDFMYLGRLLLHPDGFASDPAFRDGGTSVIDARELFYYGNSQGGIAGGALTALEPDIRRSALYVGATNYSLLIQRSVDFDPFAAILAPAYPDPLARQLIISMLQVLWDRGDPNGYAWHMTDDPYPNTPPHKVLQLLSFGDHQVANVATEVEARTLGSQLRSPPNDPGRDIDKQPYYGIPRLRKLPFDGSAALVVWDIGPVRAAGTCPEPADNGKCGTPTPPAANLPPRIGVDPHDLVIESEARIRRQIAEWIKPNGRLIEVCGTQPCRAAGWTGP